MNIRPLHRLTLAEVRDLARAAAERGEPQAAANPFDRHTDHHEQFASAFHERERDLQPESCA